MVWWKRLLFYFAFQSYTDLSLGVDNSRPRIKVNRNIYIMNLLKQIICVWLFYVVNGMILVGLVKVKIQSTVREKNASKRDNRFTRDSTQTGSWSGTISQTIFIRKNVIQMNLPKQLLARRIVFVNRISVTRGTVYSFSLLFNTVYLT